MGLKQVYERFYSPQGDFCPVGRTATSELSARLMARTSSGSLSSTGAISSCSGSADGLSPWAKSRACSVPKETRKPRRRGGGDLVGRDSESESTGPASLSPGDRADGCLRVVLQLKPDLLVGQPLETATRHRVALEVLERGRRQRPAWSERAHCRAGLSHEVALASRSLFKARMASARGVLFIRESCMGPQCVFLHMLL